MIAPIVLNLDDIAYADLLKLVTKGALRPGRITPRGAVVYELTADGVRAVEAWAEDPDGDLAYRGQLCQENECPTGECYLEACDELKEAKEEHSETQAKLDALRERVTALCNELTNARISQKARAALLALQEEPE